MNSNSLSGLLRDKRAQAAAAVGAVIGLVMFVRKGSGSSPASSTTSDGTTGTNGSLGGLYAGVPGGGGGGVPGGGGGGAAGNSDNSSLDAYTKQLSSITELLAGLLPQSTNAPVTATAVPTASTVQPSNPTPSAAAASTPLQQLQSLYAGATPGSAAQFRIADQLASAGALTSPSAPISGKLKYLPQG